MDISTIPVPPQEFQENSVTEISSITPSNKLKKASFVLFLITIFLSPLAFFPTSYAPIDTTKTAVIAFGILISSILYALSSLKEKRITIFKHPFTIVCALLALSTVISTFLSTNIQKSIIGQGFEINTASFILLMFLALSLAPRLIAKSKDRLLLVYGALVSSFLVLVIFHLVRLFIYPSFLSFGIFNSETSTLIGPWYDLGIFAGMIFLISFFAVRILSLKKNIKILLAIVMILSAFIILITNSYVLWALMALIVVTYGVYDFIQKPGSGNGFKKINSKISLVTLIVFIICLIFAWKGDSIASLVTKAPQFEQNTVSLPWQLTLDVTTDTLKEKPLFGAGPNRFGSEFLLHKPQVLNTTSFWNVDFPTGFSFLSSFVMTHGIVGGVLWIIFFSLFFVLGIKSLRKIKESPSKFTLVSTFFISAFLWVLSLFHSSSHVIIFFTFLMTGLFIAVLSSENIIQSHTFSKDSSLAKKIITILLTLFIIIFALWMLVYIRKTVAISYFQSGISALNSQNQDIDKAELDFKRALNWDKSDIYYQALSEVNIIKITSLAKKLQEENQKSPKTVDQALVQNIVSMIENSISFTRTAISIDPTNYYNYVAEARISEIALSLQIPNAYENAKTAYTNALTFNPSNPLLYLSLARVESSQNKLDEAQKYIGNALQLKPNYTEAIFLLSQIQINQGKIKDAIISTQVATQINPQNALLFFQLGFLYYNDKNYQRAVDSLQKALELDNQYANARYFLGLTLARLGRNSEAMTQFELLSQTNPENKEVALILSNLRSGKSAFADAQSPIDTKPEKRKSLPVKQK